MNTPKTRKKRGPKVEPECSELAGVEVMLDDTTRRIAAVAGAGNLSAGVRHALRAWYRDYCDKRAFPIDAPAPGPLSAVSCHFPQPPGGKP